MDRRGFLKGLLAGAVAPTIFLPKLIEVPEWKRLSKFTFTELDKITRPKWDGELFLNNKPQKEITEKMLQDMYRKIMADIDKPRVVNFRGIDIVADNRLGKEQIYMLTNPQYEHYLKYGTIDGKIITEV